MGRLKLARSNAGSMAPLPNSPRSPPRSAETESDDSRLATSSNGAPARISLRRSSARCRAAAESLASARRMTST
jgi:hypothetical protein